MNNSNHYTKDRASRNALIKAIGYGNPIKGVVIDKGHPAGPEIHLLSDTAIITIYNKNTLKMVTRLIARPGQLARFYKDGEEIPKDILNKAIHYQKMGWNNA